MFLTLNILLDQTIHNVLIQFSQIIYSSAKLITGLFISCMQTSGTASLQQQTHINLSLSLYAGQLKLLTPHLQPI